MSIDRARLRWNGWGWIDHPDPTFASPDIWTRIAEAFGMPRLPSTQAKRLEEIDLPLPRLSQEILAQLEAEARGTKITTDPFERALHARGRSYHDLLHLRSGNLQFAPDAVVYPASADEVMSVLSLANRENIAVVPFGGGSSVVGGVTGRSGPGHTGVISLDLTRMHRLISVDRTAKTATFEAGIYGPQLEESLGAQGFTLGHYPQSFEFSTLGGWIAARGAGQQSNRYGKAEKWFVSARLATPTGLWSTENFPASAAGPRLGDLIVGSEGLLGVITDATIKLHVKPEVKDYRGYLFKTFTDGISAVREMVQHGAPTAMMRLSDADETWFFQAFSTSQSSSSAFTSIAKRYLALKGFDDRPCLFVLGLEGERENVDYARHRCSAIIKAHGGFHLGTSTGERWYHSRFSAPFMRDPMMDHGLGVDTLETATQWSNIERLYAAVRDALREAIAGTMPSPGMRGVVLAHVSHSYPDGASLYFTFIFPRDLSNEIDQWRTIKTAASEAIVTNGGTISHHHGVGEDHAHWLRGEKGDVGMRLLSTIKRELDPKGILNPGKSWEPRHSAGSSSRFD
jgi:alkyldihydroxyacetonephosphate synthase